jgi:hypothetical protein
MLVPTARTLGTALAAVLTLAVLPAAGRAAVPLQRAPFVPSTHAAATSFKGQHFVIGSAAGNAHAMQQQTGPNVFVWPSHGALFVADPSLNGVMVYDETHAGNNVLPYGILAGANTALDGPVALSVGSDLPCNSACTPYLYVSNAGNDTITYYTLPLTAWNQAPAGTISWNGNSTCQPYGQPGSPSPLSNPYGIVHQWFPGNSGQDPQGQIIETSETNVSGYWINVFNASNNGPTQCYEGLSAGWLDTPSGPSMYNQSPYWPIEFNANHDTVSAVSYAGNGGGWAWSPNNSWTVGPGACTEGTAVEQGSSSSNSYVWVTTNKGCGYTASDALWSCQIGAFPSCPSNPACTNPLAKLDFPDFPAISGLTNRLYVPNGNNGTVTAYALTGSGGAVCKPKSVYVNTQTPIGVAVEY